MNCIASDASTPVRTMSSMPWIGMTRLFACESLSRTLSCDGSLPSAVSKITSLSPRAMRSPGRSGTGRPSFAPFSSVPFTLPQSRTTHSPSRKTISACLRER